MPLRVRWMDRYLYADSPRRKDVAEATGTLGEGVRTGAPKGVVIHKDHVLLGRKLSGKSQREMADLGLVVDDGEAPATAAPIPTGGTS